MRAATVEASTAIEGYIRSHDDALAVLATGETGDDDARRAVACYGRAMDHVLVLAGDPDFEWSRRVIADLHFDICWWQPGQGPGRLREGPVQVVGPGGDVRYLAPPADLVPSLVDELVGVLRDPDGPSVVRAAMAHLHVAAIHPSRDGNGRLARVVQSLVLVARNGVLAPELGSIEPYLATRTGDYHAALERAQRGGWDRWSTAGDWLRFCVHAHIDQAQRRLALLTQAARRWATLERLVADRGWPHRLVIALEQALTLGATTRTGYAAEADGSPATASADLRLLRETGLLVAHGAGRSSRYAAAPGLSGRLGAGSAEP